MVGEASGGEQIEPAAPVDGVDRAQGARPSKRAPAPACPARRILVIEDNKAVANALKRVLEIHHHSVAVAHDGRAGLDLVASFAPEVALIDIGLPGMDGNELARVLRTQRSIYLVAITGYGNETDSQVVTGPFDRYLVKPVDAGRLQATLASLP